MSVRMRVRDKILEYIPNVSLAFGPVNMQDRILWYFFLNRLIWGLIFQEVMLKFIFFKGFHNTCSIFQSTYPHPISAFKHLCGKNYVWCCGRFKDEQGKSSSRVHIFCVLGIVLNIVHRVFIQTSWWTDGETSLSSFQKCHNWVLEILSNLPQATQLESGQDKLGLASKPMQSLPIEHKSFPKGWAVYWADETNTQITVVKGRA